APLPGAWRKPAWTWQTPACEERAVLTTASRKMSTLVVLAKPNRIGGGGLCCNAGTGGNAWAMRFVRPLVASTIWKVDRIPKQGSGGSRVICGRRLIWVSVAAAEGLTVVFLTAVVVVIN